MTRVFYIHKRHQRTAVQQHAPTRLGTRHMAFHPLHRARLPRARNPRGTGHICGLLRRSRLCPALRQMLKALQRKTAVAPCATVPGRACRVVQVDGRPSQRSQRVSGTAGVVLREGFRGVRGHTRSSGATTWHRSKDRIVLCVPRAAHLPGWVVDPQAQAPTIMR